MDILDAIALGFSTALTWQNLAYCFVGVFVGTVIGVLPGLGPVPTISLLLPFSFTMNVASAVIMMAGIFYGAQYGGSITAILVRVPGEASSVVTCLDGYAMARQGRAGAALGIAAFGSFIAGVLVTAWWRGASRNQRKNREAPSESAMAHRSCRPWVPDLRSLRSLVRDTGAFSARTAFMTTPACPAGCARIIVPPCPTSRPPLRPTSLRPRYRPPRAKAGGALSRARRFRSSWSRCSG